MKANEIKVGHQVIYNAKKRGLVVGESKNGMYWKVIFESNKPSTVSVLHKCLCRSVRDYLSDDKFGGIGPETKRVIRGLATRLCGHEYPHCIESWLIMVARMAVKEKGAA